MMPDHPNSAIAEPSPDRLVGTVLAVQANFYVVRLDPAQPQRLSETLERQSAASSKLPHEVSAAVPSAPQPLTLLCTRRSRLKKLGQRVMVGDLVEIEEPDWQGGRGAISGVFPRHSQLDRPPVANADQILLVFALAEPVLDPYQLSRFLVKAESTELEVCLCFSKRDLVSEADQAAWHKRLENWGYQPTLISVHQSQGVDLLLEHLHDRITVVSGPSGVGKSSLINSLVPQANLRVAEVSGKLARGRHTTRHVELFELPGGGLLADTPGFNQPELECWPEELAQYFPEARQRLLDDSCQFSDCLHRNEPGCIVRGDWERYEHYLLLLEDAIAYQDALEQTRDEEATLKVKTGRKGRQEYEPKLEIKKYRRQSRRFQQQNLSTLQQDEEAALDNNV